MWNIIHTAVKYHFCKGGIAWLKRNELWTPWWCYSCGISFMQLCNIIAQEEGTRSYNLPGDVIGIWEMLKAAYFFSFQIVLLFFLNFKKCSKFLLNFQNFPKMFEFLQSWNFLNVLQFFIFSKNVFWTFVKFSKFSIFSELFLIFWNFQYILKFLKLS